MFIVHRVTTYTQQKMVRKMGVIFGADKVKMRVEKAIEFSKQIIDGT